jgi:hypothetical protein
MSHVSPAGTVGMSFPRTPVAVPGAADGVARGRPRATPVTGASPGVCTRRKAASKVREAASVSKALTTDEARKRLYNDPDFIALKRFGYSLKNLLDRYPDGCPDRIIASALMITEDDVATIYEQIIQKLRDRMGVE